MITNWIVVLLEVAVVGGGLVSGLFLTFSDFLMRSFKLAKSAAGIEVMQILNREIWRSVSIFLLWGMLFLSIFLSVYAYLYMSGTGEILVMSGGALYFTGSLLVSFAFNIPLNEKLDVMDYASSDAENFWHTTYVPRWVFWNYVRAFTTGGAAVCYLLALATPLK